MSVCIVNSQFIVGKTDDSIVNKQNETFGTNVFFHGEGQAS